jgi:hypothetical protein
MANEHFDKGVSNILAAVQAGISDRRVEGAVVTHEQSGQGLKVTIRVGDKTEQQAFETKEVDDCGQAIDAPAAFKVRMLVSHFVK